MLLWNNLFIFKSYELLYAVIRNQAALVVAVVPSELRQCRCFGLFSVHRYTSNSTDTDREMEFSSDRGEDLLRRVESSDEMTESFEGRRDFLYCRHVVFKPQISREDLESHLKVREIEVKHM